MNKLSLPINSATLKSGAKVAAYVGAGAVLAQAGSALAKRGLQSVADFANKDATNEAIVDTVAGVALSAAGLAVYGAVTSPAKAKAAAPFVLGGAVISAWAPVVAPHVAGAIESFVSTILPSSTPPGGYYRERFPGGRSQMDVPRIGGASSMDVPRAGGVVSHDVPVYTPLH